MDAAQVVATLQLAPHPEGGYYRETWRAPAPPGERSGGTAIYYLLLRGQRSRWHRIDAVEVWHFYAGAPLSLVICPPNETPQRLTLFEFDRFELAPPGFDPTQV